MPVIWSRKSHVFDLHTIACHASSSTSFLHKSHRPRKSKFRPKLRRFWILSALFLGQRNIIATVRRGNKKRSARDEKNREHPAHSTTFHFHHQRLYGSTEFIGKYKAGRERKREREGEKNESKHEKEREGEGVREKARVIFYLSTRAADALNEIRSSRSAKHIVKSSYFSVTVWEQRCRQQLSRLTESEREGCFSLYQSIRDRKSVV